MLPSAAEFLFVACPPEPCAGCPPPHSATTTLLPHPPMLERWVSRSPPVLHQQRRNSVEELTLLTIGQNGINNRLWGAARGRKPCYSKVFAAPRSTKGSSSLECSDLPTCTWLNQVFGSFKLAQALLERSTCSHAINKGYSSFKCRPLLTYLPALAKAKVSEASFSASNPR